MSATPYRLPPLEDLQDANALAYKRVGFASDMLEKAAALYRAWAKQSAEHGQHDLAGAQLARAAELEAFAAIRDQQRASA